MKVVSEGNKRILERAVTLQCIQHPLNKKRALLNNLEHTVYMKFTFFTGNQGNFLSFSQQDLWLLSGR